MNSADREAQHFFHTYKRLPLEIDRGEGVYLYTKDGKKYLDFFSGLAVNALGYAHPRVVEAIHNQARKYIHLSNYYLQDPQLTLADMLIKYSGYSKVFFTNSGTESIEGALKIVRRWGAAKQKTDVVAFSNSFHGRTLGALSLMDRQKYREGFGPFLPHCSVVNFNNINDLRKAITPKTSAIFLEFIQGEGGIDPVHSDTVDEMKTLRDKYGFLIVADEIQSGIGRTGKFFGFQHYDVTPDIVVIAKPIGGGLPLGAILGGNPLADVLSPGMHGTTFGGNPVACAAGIVVLDEIMERGLMQHAETMGTFLKEELLQCKHDFPALIKEVRGFGLMHGMELTRGCDTLADTLRERGILVNCTNQTVLRFLPPLIIKKEHIEEVISHLREVLTRA